MARRASHAEADGGEERRGGAAAPRPAPPTSVAAVSSATKTKRRASGTGRKLVMIGAILGALVIVVGGGYFALSFFGGNSRPVEKAVLAPRKERKPAVKPDKSVPRPDERGEAETRSRGARRRRPAHDPRGQAPGLRGEAGSRARRSLGHGPRGADNIPAVDALKDVEAQIVERDQVAESMEQIRHAYKQERYEDALRMLYRLPSEMQRGEIEKFKANAWYNNGINYLLGGNTAEAVHCFEESLTLDPHDQQAQRLKAYSKTYSDREKDSAFRAFVDQLDKRPIDTQIGRDPPLGYDRRASPLRACPQRDAGCRGEGAMGRNADRSLEGLKILLMGRTRPMSARSSPSCCVWRAHRSRTCRTSRRRSRRTSVSVPTASCPTSTWITRDSCFSRRSEPVSRAAPRSRPPSR